jgi:hypothetical protein
MGITSLVDDSYLQKYENVKSRALSETTQDGYAKLMQENPLSRRKATKVGMDWLMNYKGLSRKEAKETLKKTKESPKYESSNDKPLIDMSSEEAYFKNMRGDNPPNYAMGGGIPGAVGFTYARTINPAPSNGKYAKKTKASAQDGIIVNDLNDPRLKKYQDSLAAYNKSNDLYKQLLKMGKQGNEGIREQVRDKMSLKEVNYRGNVGMPYSYEGIKPDYVLGTRTPTENRGYLPHYKKPTQLIEYQAPKVEVKMAPKGTKKLFINDVEVDEPTFNKIVPRKGGGMQNGGEMKYYQEGLDFKPNSIAKDGGAIVDPMGQWAHPGEVTIIPDTNITMEGVDYPVLGISDTGDQQMMYPGEDYNFDGEYVTEYPMMKNGGWLDKYK